MSAQWIWFFISVVWFLFMLENALARYNKRTRRMSEDHAAKAPLNEFIFEQAEWQKRYLHCQHEHSDWHAPVWENGMSNSYFCFKCGQTWVYLDESGLVYASPPLE